MNIIEIVQAARALMRSVTPEQQMKILAVLTPEQQAQTMKLLAALRIFG